MKGWFTSLSTLSFLDEREDGDETGCCPVAEGVNQTV